MEQQPKTIDDRFKYLLELSKTLPQQRTPEWYKERALAANSSQYETMMNVWGNRNRALSDAIEERMIKRNYAMAIGTTFERVSGYLFYLATGLTYKEIGSVQHPKYPRIRGSVDGFGLDRKGKLYVLETKTPSRRIPSDCVSSPGYLYQMLQNIEILDADYCLFNDVRLLACPTSLIDDPDSGYPLDSPADVVQCSFERHRLADPKYPCPIVEDISFVEQSLDRKDLPPVTIVAAGLKRTSPFNDEWISSVIIKLKGRTDTWLGNLFDSYPGQHPFLQYDDVVDILTKFDFDCVSIDHTRARGEEAKQWADEVYAKYAEDPRCCACVFFKVDVHLIQFIHRDTEFWLSHLKPIADQWIGDIDSLIRGKDVPPMPRMEKKKCPLPNWLDL